MESKDDVLIAKAIAGDSAALGDLLRTYGPRLREQLSIDKRWQSVLEADDVLQVTYLEAFLKIGSFTPGATPAAFVGWLKRIAENNLRDAIKGFEAAKRPPPQRAATLPTGEDSSITLLDILGVSTATPSRAAASNEAQISINEALKALPPDYATVIREYDLNGKSIEDVAAAVGRSPGAVHMLRARAHDRLRELLGPGSNFFTHAP